MISCVSLKKHNTRRNTNKSSESNASKSRVGVPCSALFNSEKHHVSERGFVKRVSNGVRTHIARRRRVL